jgi:putative ABC transport system permease protein
VFRNYLTIALRNFRRQPGYTLLNILGLTLGITTTLFILLYLTEETRFDTHHLKAERIHRISSDLTEPDDHFRWASTQLPLGMHLKETYPEVEEYVRFIENGTSRLEHKDHFFFAEKTFLVDSTFADVFTFNFLKGNGKTALQEPNSLVLAESVAKRIFGDNNPIGETLNTSSGTEYKVTGVYEDMPHHSHLIANVLFSASSAEIFRNPTPNTWGGFRLLTYVLLKEGTDPKSFEAKLPEVIEKHVTTIFDQFDIKVKYELIPLLDIHLKSDFEGEPEPTGQIGFLYIFGAIGVFLLLLACINYMNLATARATKRAMEVGIRKVLGSERRQLIIQFLAESILFTLFALVLSFAFVIMLLPIFNATFDLTLSSDLLWSSNVLLGAVGIMIFVGILGGSYPAFYLSGFPPIAILKGSNAKGSGNVNLRKSLVVVQFAVTIFMLIGTGIIYDQMNFLRDKDLGFEKENILKFEISPYLADEKLPILKTKLAQNPKVLSIGSASSTPGSGYGKNLSNMETNTGTMGQYGVDGYSVDYDFFSTMGIEIVEGRNFSNEFATDSIAAVLVNESMVKRLGWNNPIGKKVQFGTADTLPISRVVGVVKDFHQNSLYEPISALLFYPNRHNGHIHARINPKNPSELSAIIASVERTWQEVFPNTPFEFDFVDSAFMELYEADQIRARIFTLFSVMMILIACLGLLGLASFSAEQRTKEIGVRKVLGAETKDIVFLLTRNFVFLVMVSTIPAFIAARYFMTKWLDTFAYHANMNYVLYGVAFFLVVVLTLVTTGYFALRAAHRNPVEALRSE